MAEVIERENNASSIQDINDDTMNNSEEANVIIRPEPNISTPEKQSKVSYTMGML